MIPKILPENWLRAPLKRFLTVSSGEMISADDETPEGHPIYGGNGIRGYTNKANTQSPALVIGRVGANCGNIHLVDSDFWASEHALVVYPRREFNLRYGKYLLTALNLNQFAIRTAQPLINTEAVVTQISSWPVYLEAQRVIADYLDRETERIDALVAEKEKMLALLEEKRAALISRAVTRGLNPNVSLKPSGLRWLGDIPTHWETRRLKYLTDEPLAYGANEPALEDNRDWPRFVRITDINENGTLRDETFRSLSPEVAEPYLLERGDVLFARSGATVGKSFIYRADWGKACFAGYLIRFRSAQELILSEFIYYFSLSDMYWHQVNSGLIQATIQNFSAEKYAELDVCLPPLSEQQTIVDFITEVDMRNSTLLTEIRKSIELLKERRAALITAAVTGRIPVEEMSARNWSA